METKKVSLIIFYDQQKRILLQDRRNISKAGEEWGYFGGKIEEGETKEQAIIRETREELDFDLKEYKFLCEYNYTVPINLQAYVFISPLKDNLKKFTLKEGQGMKLFTLDQARKLKFVCEEDKKPLDMLEKSPSS